MVILDQYTQVSLTVAGELQKEARLFNWLAGGNDLIYGGLGDDFIHGGAGDDAHLRGRGAAAVLHRGPGHRRQPAALQPGHRLLRGLQPGDPRSKIPASS